MLAVANGQEQGWVGLRHSAQIVHVGGRKPTTQAVTTSCTNGMLDSGDGSGNHTQQLQSSTCAPHSASQPPGPWPPHPSHSDHTQHTGLCSGEGDLYRADQSHLDSEMRNEVNLTGHNTFTKLGNIRLKASEQ